MDTATALRLKHSRHRIYTTDELEALFCSSVRCKECQKIGGLDRIGFAVRNCAASVCINPRLYIGGIRDPRVRADHFCFCKHHRVALVAFDENERRITRNLQANATIRPVSEFTIPPPSFSFAAGVRNPERLPTVQPSEPSPPSEPAAGIETSFDENGDDGPVDRGGGVSPQSSISAYPSSPKSDISTEHHTYSGPEMAGGDVASYALLISSHETCHGLSASHTLRPHLDYRLYAVDCTDGATRLNFRESHHTRVRYFLLLDTKIVHPIIICECRQLNATVAQFMRNEISDSAVLREIESGSCAAVLQNMAILQAMECVHAKYIRSLLQDTFILLESRTDDEELDQFMDYLKQLNTDDIQFLLLTEPVKRHSDVAYDVAAPSQPDHIGVSARGWLRAERHHDNSRYVCHASTCKASSSCPHAAIARDTSIGESKIASTRVVTMKPTIDVKISESAKYSALQTITRWRRGKRPSEWNAFVTCICSAEDSECCRCRYKCECGSIMQPDQESSHIVIKCYGTNFCEERLSLPARFQCASSGCGLSQAMQPVDFGVIEMFPQTAVTVDLLESFLRHIEKARSTIAAFYRVIENQYTTSPHTDAGLIYNFMSRTAWTSVVWEFFLRLDRDYDSLFSCPTCGTFGTAPILIADGTPTSCAAQFAESTSTGAMHERLCVPEDEPVRIGLNLAERCLISDATIRNAILELNASLGALDVIKEVLLGRLITLTAADANLRWLQFFLESLPASWPARAPLVAFISQFAYPSVIVGGLLKDPTTTKSLLERLAQWPVDQPVSFSIQKDLSSRFPVLSDVMTLLKLNAPAAIVPQWLRVLASEVARFIYNPAVPNEAEAWRACDGADDFINGCYLPGNSGCRTKGARYMRATRDAVGKDGALHEEEVSCKKEVQQTRFKLPGVFIYSCPHGLVLGFHVMRLYESPHTPFLALFNRRKTAPAVFVYDNACKLAAYCQLREPGFFRNTAFFSDRLHWKNHTGCSKGFSLDPFVAFKAINSESCEQINYMLTFIRSASTFMLLRNFMLYLRHYASSLNEQRRREYLKSKESSQRWLSVDALIDACQRNGWT